MGGRGTAGNFASWLALLLGCRGAAADFADDSGMAGMGELKVWGESPAKERGGDFAKKTVPRVFLSGLGPFPLWAKGWPKKGRRIHKDHAGFHEGRFCQIPRRFFPGGAHRFFSHGNRAAKGIHPKERSAKTFPGTQKGGPCGGANYGKFSPHS